MAIPTNPELLKMPFARDGDKNSIPETTGATTGLFSQQYGFQPINSLPLTAGGKAVSRLDWNGAVYMLSNLLFYLQRGYTFVYDNTMDYVEGCRVLDPNDGQAYICTADVAAGTGAPSATPANWALAPSSESLGYRQPNTTYTVGDIAFHPNLPTGYYLECTTAGTTSSGALSTGGISVYGTITDGTVTWTVCDIQTAIHDKVGNALEGVVAKSVGQTGYIKYSSGLKVQWGHAVTDSDGLAKVTYPISFDSASTFKYMARIANSINDNHYLSYAGSQTSYVNVRTANGATGVRGVDWLAIGF